MAVSEIELEQHLRAILREIEPTTSEKSAASRSHSFLRLLLTEGTFGKRVVGTFLSGSYVRSTALRPLKDVDIIFEVDPAGWKAAPFSSKPAPQTILKSFERCIRDRYPNSSLRLQRRSVCLRLNHLDMDVVPAIPVPNRPGVLLIPDRRGGDWIMSGPQLHSRIATDINELRAKRFKPLVKLLKLWNHQLPDNTRCKSFTIETIAVRIFQRTDFESLAEGLLLFWDHLAARHYASIHEWRDKFGMCFNMWSVEVPDSAGLSGNTAASMDHNQALRLCEKARISRDHMVSALNARTVDSMSMFILKALRVPA